MRAVTMYGPGDVRAERCDDARIVRPFVVGSFCVADNTCANCGNGWQSSCTRLDFMNGCQAECIRVPYADGMLVATDEYPDETYRAMDERRAVKVLLKP